MSQLEEAVGQLSHFITGELRPDLSAGALSGEVDWGMDDPGYGEYDKLTDV